MATNDPLGPFSQYLTQPLEPQKEPQPTGFEGWGGAIAHAAQSFMNGVRQSKLQNFAMQQIQQAKEENAYNQAIQHVMGSGLPTTDKERIAAQLSIPLVQRIAADKDASSKSTGNHMTDFFKGIATNLVGGNLPKKQQPLDMGAVTQALLYASDPANSLATKVAGLDAQANQYLQEIEQKAKSEGRAPTSDDVFAHPGISKLHNQYLSLDPTGKGLPSVTSYLGEHAQQKQISPIQIKAKYDEALKTFMSAHGIADESLVPADVKDRILEEVGGIKAVPTAEQKINYSRTSFVHGSELPTDLNGTPLEKDATGNPVNRDKINAPYYMYGTDLGGLARTVLPVDKSQWIEEKYQDPKTGRPMYGLRNRYSQEFVPTGRFAPVQPGSSTLTGETAEGIGITNKTPTFSPPPSSNGSPTAAPSSTPQKPATPAENKPTGASNPKNIHDVYAAFGLTPSTQAPPQTSAQSGSINGVYAKSRPLTAANNNLLIATNRSMKAIGELKNLLQQKDPKTGVAFKDENTLFDRGQDMVDAFVRRAGIAPDAPKAAIMDLAGLNQAFSTSAFANVAKGKTVMDLTAPHIADASTNTGKLMWGKLLTLENELKAVPDFIKEAEGTRIRPGGGVVKVPGTQPPPSAATDKQPATF